MTDELKPVAWMYGNAELGRIYSDRFPELSSIAGFTETPLYTRQPDPAVLVEALEAVLPFVATQVIGCKGDKCREAWCYSCSGDEEAEEAAQAGCEAMGKARRALAQWKDKSHDR